MPDGNRGNEPATLAAFGYVSALILCCIIVGVLAYGLGGQDQRRYDTPASYAKAAKADAESACVGREGPAAFECIYEKVESAQEQARGEQDLSAQQRAANSAMIAAIIALATLVLSGVGVWYVKRTLEATLEAVKDTGVATRAMRIANVIARKSQASNLAANKAQVRAYLSLVKLRIEDGKNGQDLHYEIVNSGQSPARATNVYWIIARQEFPHLPLHKINPIGDIPAGGNETARLDLGTQPPWDAFAQPMDIIVIQARAQFIDVFETRQSDPTEFLMFIDNDGRFQMVRAPN